MLKTKIIFLFSLCIFIFFLTQSFSRSKKFIQPANHAPVVKIILPANHISVAPGARVHYEIDVSDKEDGDSKYDELNAKEVLLEVKYIADTSTLKTQLSKSYEDDAPGLAAMRTSNCFNCHAFDAKVIGPSFDDINNRYTPTPSNITLLEKRIKDGSTGIWGKPPMPTHPELSNEQIEKMVQWITHDASTSGTNYYIGFEGNINLQIPPHSGRTGAFILTASYIDHGINHTGKRLEGKDIIVIFAK